MNSEINSYLANIEQYLRNLDEDGLLAELTEVRKYIEKIDQNSNVVCLIHQPAYDLSDNIFFLECGEYFNG